MHGCKYRDLCPLGPSQKWHFNHFCRQSTDRIDLKFGEWTHYGAFTDRYFFTFRWIRVSCLWLSDWIQTNIIHLCLVSQNTQTNSENAKYLTASSALLLTLLMRLLNPDFEGLSFIKIKAYSLLMGSFRQHLYCIPGLLSLFTDHWLRYIMFDK